MFQILQVYLDIALFRRGPDSIPASTPLFALTLAVDGALTVLVLAAFGADPALQLMKYFLGLIMLFSLVWLVLNALQLDARFLQAITAILGADIFLTVLQLVVALVGSDLQSITSVEEAPATLAALGLLNWWGLAIIGFVVKRAGQLNLLAAIGVVVAVFVLTRGASNLLFG